MIHCPRQSRGVTLIEVLVVLGILLVVGLMIITALPASRENARAARCRQHLQNLGASVLLYDNAVGRLPTVPEPGRDGASPAAAMMGQLGLTRFAGLAGAKDKSLLGSPGPPPPPTLIPDLICPSDPWALGAEHPAPISYRACAGDGPDGSNGPFAFGRWIGLIEVRAGDGAEYTAGFAERLVGNGQPAGTGMNYRLVAGPVDLEGCPPDTGSPEGDAGADWSKPTWTMTLYNHGLTPDAPSSCVADDGRTALMGASSGHPDAVHVLMLDGSLKTVTPTIAPGVWKSLATPFEATGE